MKKWILCTAMLVIFLTSNVWASNEDNKTAQQLIDGWFAAIKNNDIAKAETFLAPTFMSIHTDGITRNKTEEITLLKKLHMTDYHLTDFMFSEAGNTMIVTFKDKTSEQIDNKEVAPKAAGRMAVLQKQGKKWIMIAYANLDQIN